MSRGLARGRLDRCDDDRNDERRHGDAERNHSDPLRPPVAAVFLPQAGEHSLEEREVHSVHVRPCPSRAGCERGSSRACRPCSGSRPASARTSSHARAGSRPLGRASVPAAADAITGERKYVTLGRATAAALKAAQLTQISGSRSARTTCRSRVQGPASPAAAIFRHDSAFGPHNGSPSGPSSWIFSDETVFGEAASLICPVSCAW